jgi:hypothetical protein
LAPGASPTSGRSPFISFWGHGVDQNAWIVDGTNVSASSNGIMRSEFGIDFIEEITILSIGASAEYGNAQGAIINVLTRQGSNRFLWDLSYYGQPAALTSQPIIRPIKVEGCCDTPAESGYERQRYRDATTTLGGPIRRDRLWFFAGYQYFRDVESQPGADPRIPKDFQQDKLFGKLTWHLAPGWRLEQSVHGERWDNRELPTSTKHPDATQRVHASVWAWNLGHLTQSSKNRVLDVTVGGFRYLQDIDAAFPNPEKYATVNRQTNVTTGAPVQVGELEQTRWSGKATLSWLDPAMFGAGHLFKIGGQLDRGYHRSLLVVPNGKRYEDNPATGTRLQFASGPSNAAGLFMTASGFVTDEITVGNRLTISAGLRFDHSRGILPDIRELDAAGVDTGRLIPGDGLKYTWNVLSPRAGVVLKLTADGRTLLRGSYGLFRQGILTGELSPDHPGVAAVFRTRCTVDMFNCTAGQIEMDPKKQVDIDPKTRAPRTDAYSIGIDREITQTVSMSAVYVHNNGRDFIGWRDTCECYTKGSEPVNGQMIPVDRLTQDPANRHFELANQEDYSLTYDGLALVVEKRLSNRWQANVSYTWSRAVGLQPSSGTTAAGAQVATTGAPPVSFAPPVTFGRDPNTLIGAYGRLPNDRPHLFRFVAAYDVPKMGILIAANLQHASGKPWAHTADITLAPGQDNLRILLEPRGTRRLSSQTVLDLRVAKSFALGRAGRIELRADLLNLLNDTAEEGIESDRWDAGAALGLGNVFLDPRRAMLSVKMSLGR